MIYAIQIYVCMCKHMGQGFSMRFCGPRNGICSCFFMIRLGPHWHEVKLERASVLIGSLNQIGTS